MAHKYWDCEPLRRGECQARAVTEETEAGLKLIKGPNQSVHTHPPDTDSVRAEVGRQRLHSQAVEQLTAPPAILLRDELPEVEPEVLARLSIRENLKRVIPQSSARSFSFQP